MHQSATARSGSTIPDLAIDWGIEADRAVLSEKDARAPAFRDFDTPFLYEPAA